MQQHNAKQNPLPSGMGSVNNSNPKIISLGFATPPDAYSQDDALAMLGYTSPSVRRIFANSGIERRHFWCNPVGKSWQELCEEYFEGALTLSVQAIRECLDDRAVRSIGCIVFCSVTGYTCPSMSYWIAKEMGMREDIVHSNILGEGCEAAIPGLKRAYDFSMVTGKMSLVVACEICSASFFPAPEKDLENTVANAIFADASSAALVGFDDDPRHPEIMDFESQFSADHIDLLGYKWVEGRLKVVLSKDVPNVVPPLMRKAIDRMLERNLLKRGDIRHWLLHPGGVKVLENLEEELGLSRVETQPSWDVLKDYGNCSSATIGLIGKRARQGQLGGYTVVVSMGAGVAVDCCLLNCEE